MLFRVCYTMRAPTKIGERDAKINCFALARALLYIRILEREREGCQCRKYVGNCCARVAYHIYAIWKAQISRIVYIVADDMPYQQQPHTHDEQGIRDMVGTRNEARAIYGMRQFQNWGLASLSLSLFPATRNNTHIRAHSNGFDARASERDMYVCVCTCTFWRGLFGR